MGTYIFRDRLVKPVYIKDEGDFFTIPTKQGKVNIPKNLLSKFKKWLWDCRITLDPASEL